MLTTFTMLTAVVNVGCTVLRNYSRTPHSECRLGSFHLPIAMQAKVAESISLAS